ncbi:hypothetical protein AgCh_034371 [Apium graveolens]
MENANAQTDNVELKVPQFTLAFDTDDIYELRLFLKTLHVKLNKVQIKNIKFNPSANNVKSIHEEGTTSESRSKLITEKSEQVHINSVNIGSMTQKQLKQKLKDLYMKDKRKRSRKNKNGKVGKILGYGKIKVGNVIIENVALVAGLKHNLISVSQICDRGYHVNFYKEHCQIVSKSNDNITLTGVRYAGTGIKDSHLKFNNINELVRKDLVRGLPNAVFTSDGLCDSCQKAKQRKTSFKSKTKSLILEPYHLLHVDLFGPVNVMSIAKKRYALVIVDEYTRYTWVYFLHTKDETLSILLDHVRELEKGSTYKVKIIRSDNGTEFKNSSIEEFCKLEGIK